MNGIGQDFFKIKPLCCFMDINLHKQINGACPSHFFLDKN